MKKEKWKMKKLLIALGAVAIATVSQAASFNWKTKTGQAVYQAGTTTTAGSVTAYLFNADVVSRDALVAAFIDNGKGLTDFTSLSSKATSAAGAIASTVFSADKIGTETSLTAYFAIISGDNIFVSAEVSGQYQATSTTPLQFSPTTASKAAVTEWTTGTTSVAAGGGWYTAVPEPTSGLLMLLGMAGLALRRRRV